jgi:hypothetical protein
VDVLAECLHAARESAIRNDLVSRRVPTRLRMAAHSYLPTVVEVNVDVAPGRQPRRDQAICGLLDEGFVDVAAEMVPAVPAHGRGQADAVVQRGAHGQQQGQQQWFEHYNFGYVG